MKLILSHQYENCLLLGKESMKAYFADLQIPWDYENRLKLYATFEIYEVYEEEFIGYLAFREHQGSIYIADLQIVEPHRNKGFGTQLLAKAKEIAKAKGFNTIKLKVFKNSPAINLYQRNGYIKIHEEKYVYVLSLTM